MARDSELRTTVRNRCYDGVKRGRYTSESTAHRPLDTTTGTKMGMHSYNALRALLVAGLAWSSPAASAPATPPIQQPGPVWMIQAGAPCQTAQCIQQYPWRTAPRPSWHPDPNGAIVKRPWRTTTQNPYNPRPYSPTYQGGIGRSGSTEPEVFQRRRTQPVQSNQPPHIRWCEERYRSYRARDNSFGISGGGRRQCISPYSQ